MQDIFVKLYSFSIGISISFIEFSQRYDSQGKTINLHALKIALISPEVFSKLLMTFKIIYYDKRLSIVKFQKRAIEYFCSFIEKSFAKQKGIF